MKYYSWKKYIGSGLDHIEWHKHILNLENKIDSLFHYLYSIYPNYTNINWNALHLNTDEKLMYLSENTEKGAIYKDTQSNIEYYFIKCFNNNDLIWCKNNICFINDWPSLYWINSINLANEQNLTLQQYLALFSDDESSKVFQPQENSWLLMDFNIEQGYKLLPSTSGFGGVYKTKWITIGNEYYLQYDLIDNGKDVVVHFFNNPLQTRWNLYNTTISENEMSITTYSKDIKNTNNEYYQAQKQLMRQMLIKDTREPVIVDYIHTEDNISYNWQRETFHIKNKINVGVYYW